MSKPQLSDSCSVATALLSTSDKKTPENGVDMHANPDISRRQHASQLFRCWHVVSDWLLGWLYTLTLRYTCRPQDTFSSFVCSQGDCLFDYCGLTKSCKAAFQSIGVAVISIAVVLHIVSCTQPMRRKNLAVKCYLSLSCWNDFMLVQVNVLRFNNEKEALQTDMWKWKGECCWVESEVRLWVCAGIGRQRVTMVTCGRGDMEQGEMTDLLCTASKLFCSSACI